jgi:hypothetical protein
MTLGEKLSAVINIILRFGADEGERRYKAKYDFNDDGTIDEEDIIEVLKRPTCRIFPWRR